MGIRAQHQNEYGDDSSPDGGGVNRSSAHGGVGGRIDGDLGVFCKPQSGPDKGISGLGVRQCVGSCEPIGGTLSNRCYEPAGNGGRLRDSLGRRPVIDALAVVGVAAVPVGELRFAVPWAMVHFGFPWYQAFILALIGNLIPVLILPVLLQRIGHLLLQAPKPVGNVFRWRIERLKGGAGPWVEKYGRWALVPFVATPLPFTGAWTGCLLAWAMTLNQEGQCRCWRWACWWRRFWSRR